MATKIVTKNSSTASAVPTASDLVQGELAVNVADKRLFTEDNAGAIVELGTNPSGNVTFQDNGKALFGAGSDLQIYHDGNNSYINDAGTGALLIRGSNVSLAKYTGETMVNAFADGRVDLYYDNAIKLTTVTGGIDVTGTATMDGLTVDSGTVDTVATFQSSGDANAYVVVKDSGSSGGAFIGAVGTDTILGTGGSTERMRISSAGNVGIGTGSPSAGIDVVKTGSVTVGNFETDGNSTVTIKRTGASATTSSIIASSGGKTTLASSGYTTFDTSGSERIRIDSSGNVGIGNTVASSMNGGANQLVVGSGSTGQGITLYSSASTAGSIHFADGTSGDAAYRGQLVYNHSGDYMAMLTAATERMRIDASGRLGINNSSPVEMLTIGSTSDTNVRVQFLSSTTGANTIQFGDGTGASAYSGYINYTHSDNALAFATGGSERMRIDATGNLLVGTTSTIPFLLTSGSGAGITSSGTIMGASAAEAALFNRVSGDGAVVSFFRTGTGVGNISVAAGSTSYNTSSDQRLKDNIADADDAGSKIDAIQVRQYDWKADGSHQDYGMIAQELLEVAPEAVHQPEDSEEMMGVDYSKLVPMLVKEIQSLRNRVAQLEE
jgi:hypothetical protein